MAIYDAGTASLAADGTVIGVGTTWRQPLTLIRVGATMIFNTTPASIVTIAEIISDTEIRVFNDKGFTAPAGTQYSILAHDGITVQGLAQDVAETLRYYQSRETEVADAVDAFNNFDSADFESKVSQVNTQHGDVVTIGSQIANDAAQVSLDKDSALAASAEAQNSASIAETAAESVSGALVGNFDDGVTLKSKNQVIIQFIDGYAKQFLWNGPFPKVVPQGSTPESTNSDGEWIDLGLKNGYSISGIDISQLVSGFDSSSLNQFFSSVKNSGLNVYSSVPLTFEIDSEVTMYGDFDLSNCTFNLSGGRCVYDDERDASSIRMTSTPTSYPLNELSRSLSVSGFTSDWNNSLVKITSNEVDLYRYLNGVYTPRNKGEVNFITKSGELAYSLKNTYNSGVNVELYKIPSSRKTIILPSFSGVITSFGLDVRRSMTDVYVNYKNQLGQITNDRSIVSSGFTYDVHFYMNSSGVQQDDNNSRYTALMEYTLKARFDGGIVGSGWRSVDGNYCRDVSFENCSFDSLHMHYGCSGVYVSNCKIPGGVFVGTGAFDESTRIVNSDIGNFGIRTDYGEHKGDFIVDGCKVQINRQSTGTVDLLLCRSDNVIASGNPLQPRKLHLPRNIIVKAVISWPDAATLNLISFKNNFKTSAERDFVVPSLIDFSGSVFDGVNARFEFAQSYYNSSSMNPMTIKINPSKSIAKFQFYIGYLAELNSSRLNLELNGIDVKFNNVSSSSVESKLLCKGCIVRRFTGYSGSLRYQGYASFDSCIFDVDGANNLVAGFSSFVNCVFDGRNYESINSTRPIINSYAHISNGNIALRAMSTDSRDVVDKKRLICPRSDEAGNFNVGEIQLVY